MAHQRKLVRHAVVALLAAASTAAGDRVLGTRVDPHKPGKLPALSVYTLNDLIDEEASSATEEVHELELEITGWVAHTDAVPADDAMDDLAEQVEAAMKEDEFLGGKANEVRFAGTVMQVVETGNDPLVGVVVLTYFVTYRVDPFAPAELDDFLSVDASHEVVGGVNDTVPAREVFIVQEVTP